MIKCSKIYKLFFLIFLVPLYIQAQNNKAYYETGELKDFWYAKTKETTIRTSYYKNGKIKSIGPTYNGMKNGNWKFYHENGLIEKKVAIKENRRDGYLEYFNKEAKLVSSGNFINNAKNGKWKHREIDGSFQIISYKRGLKDGEFSWFYPNGTNKELGFYSNDQKQGKWRFFSEEGNLETSGKFSYDKKIGLWKYFHKNGQVASMGKLEENELNHGEWKHFHENGQLFKVVTHDNGKLLNVEEYFAKDGKPLEVGSFIDGNGTLHFYTEEGTFSHSKVYENGLAME